MAEVTGFGVNISALNTSIKQAEESFNRLKRTGVATAQAINKAFADASNGGIQQMRQSIDNMFSALSKDGGAQKSIEKIGQAVTNVGTQATKSATGIDALIRSIAMGGDAYASLMAKINGAGQSGTKNSELVKIEKSIEENKKKLAELKTYIDQFGKSEGLTEGARREAAEIKNTIDMLERKKESLLANIRLQERLSAHKNDGWVFNQNTAAKQSSDAYVKAYDSAIKDYEKAWESVDKRLAQKKVAEYKATLTEMMSLDKSMYSSDKGGKAGTEDARIVEARYKELTQKKLALENELDQLIARNKENAENKLAQQVENIKKRSDARISAESQRRAVQESNQELAETKRTQKEKLAEYKATLAEMKSLDGKIYAVDTKGNSAERASIEESRRRYEELSARKEAIENELGKKIADIRKRYEAEVQSETAKRLINERNAQEAESKRIQAQKVADYKATIAEMRSLDKSIYQVDSKGTESEKAAIEASRQRYVQLAKDKEALENELGSRVARIRSRYEAQVVSETGKRIVSERLAKEAEAKRELNEARRVAREKAAEERRAMQEKIANYKATLAEMKTLDRNIYQVDTRGNSAEIAAMSESKARYAQLNKDKEAMEQELGRKVVRIRNRFEAEVQSEAGRRAVQTRIQRENEAKREANEAKRIAREKAAEERRIEQEKLREYRSIRSQMLSLDNDMYLVRKKGTTPEDAARLDEMRRREQELNRERARLSQELGDKKSKIDREYDNRYLAQVAKRYIREREISLNETKQLKREVRREYEQLLKETDGILKKMRNAEKLGGKTSSDPTVRNIYAEYERQLNAYDAQRKALESQFQAWVADLQARNTTKKLDEDINAIRKRQAEEQAAAAAKAKADSAARQQSYQSYVTSYEGAMRVSNKVFDRQLSENEHIKAIENLTAARKKLNESDSNYKKQVEKINKAIQEHQEFLAKASRTTDQNTEAARRNTEQQRRRQEQLDRSSKSPSEILATDTTNMTLRQLQNFSASIKATMADLIPRSNEWNQLNSVLQNTNNRINGIKREMGLLRDSTKDASDAMANLGRFMNIAFVAQRLWSFTNSVVKLTGEFEQMQVALKTIVGGLEASNKIWEQTVELASKSPFKATELIKYTRQLAAYRIETSKLHDTTKMLADVSAGLGVDMSRLILAYGQVRAAEYLRGTELRQFTEAGVPMLEELAKHFTELEGKAISTAEVFEMISKRQVAFSDVSAVLENMTSDGGPFYKMQEQLSNTIKGNIATLKNEVDLMMYEIGQSSSWAITGFLKILKFLVKQWEYISVILTTVLGLYIGYQAAALKVAISSGAVAKAVAGETIALTGLAGAFAKAKMAMQAFNTTMMSTPIGWIIAAIMALISVITLVVRKVNAAKKAREERAQEIEDEMKRISEAYEGMRERVESALSVFDDAESSSKDAEVALYKLIDIAKEEYHMTFVVDVTGKSKEQLEEEARNIATQTLAAGEDAESLERKWEETWSTMLVEYDDYVMKLNKIGEKTIEINGEELPQNIYETYAKKSGTQEAELQDLQKTVADYFSRIKDTIKKESTDAQNIANLHKSPSEILKEYLGGKANKTFEEEEMYSAVLAIEQAYNTVADQIISSNYLSSDKGDAINLFLNRLKEGSLLTAEQIKDLEAILEGKLGGDLNVVGKSLTSFQEKFNTFLAKVPDASLAGIDSDAIYRMGDKYKKQLDNGKRSYDFARFFEAISPGSNITQEQLAKQVKEELDKWKAIKKAYEEAIAKGMESIYTKGDYEIALKGIEFLDPVNVYLGNTEKNSSGKNKLEEANKKRIELLKKMNTQFLNEFKTFGDEAEPEIRAAYEKAFGEVFKKTTIKLPDVDFTSKEGMVKALEALRPYAKKAGKDAVEALETEIAKFKGEIKIEARKDKFQDTLDEVEELFDKYELSLEIKKLNIPPDLAKNLFGEEYLTLDELKVKTRQEFVGDVADADKAKQLTDELNKGLAGIDWNIVEGILGTDQMKELKKTLEKIDDIEDKAAKERMKTYSKYLVEGMNDRVKLKIEEMRKLKEIEESPEFTTEQKEKIKEQVSKEAREEQDKQEWEAFKGTEMYTMMFDDLEHLGTKALDALQKKLEELKGSLSDLPATEVKEIVQQISKIEDMVIEKTNPFKYMRELKKELKGMKSEDEYQIQLLDATKMQEDAQKYIDAYDTAMSALMSEDEGVFEEMDSDTLATWTEMLRLAEEQGKTVKEIYDIKKDDLETGKKQASEADKGLRTHKKAKKTLEQQANAWSEYESKASEAFAVTKELMTTLGADTDGVAMSLVESSESLVMLTFQAIQFGIQMQIAGYQANMALGVIGWILIAVQAIATILAAIFSAKDKALQKEIEGHLNEVEKLKEDYEELEALMENAWNTADIAHYNAEMKKTMNLAIEAQKAAIKAQESRKGANKEGSDTYNELQDMKAELEDMQKTIAESLEESFSKVTDGILDEVLDAAKDFTDAWYDAFKETGDGLSGLEENFEEMFMNLAKNQAAMQITGAFTEQWKEALKDYINDEDTELTKEDAASWAEEVRSSLPELNAALEAFLGTISEGLGGKSGSLSELQKGIQGVTEETAQVLESLLNSMRLYVADTNMHIKDQTDYIKKMWKMMDDSVTGSSPFYVQMKNI
jgi:uncharacterized membrane protein